VTRDIVDNDSSSEQVERQRGSRWTRRRRTGSADTTRRWLGMAGGRRLVLEQPGRRRSGVHVRHHHAGTDRLLRDEQQQSGTRWVPGDGHLSSCRSVFLRKLLLCLEHCLSRTRCNLVAIVCVAYAWLVSSSTLPIGSTLLYPSERFFSHLRRNMLTVR